MFRRTIRTNQIQYTLILGFIAAFFVISIVLFPDKAFEASLHGLHIWWKIIFPALLPFLILSEVLIAYGILHFLGVWLEPLMRIVFRLPGISGPVMAIGYTVGYPTGAKLTQQLRKNNAIGRSEGEALLALSHAASPVLVINVIAVGFFQNVQLGFMLLMIQLLSLITMGIIIRFVLRDERSEKIEPNTDYNLMRKALLAMEKAHEADGRTFGKLLGDAVSSAIQTLMMIGGYMMILSVAVQVMNSSQLTHLLYDFSRQVMPDSITSALFKGMFEVHLGTFAISKAAAAPLLWQMALISCLLAWSGFALHAQVKSIIHDSDLRYSTFLSARLLQAILAIWFTLWLWAPLQRFLISARPTFLDFNHDIVNNLTLNHFKLGYLWGGSILLMSLLLIIMLVISMLLLFIKKINSYLKT